jgi:PhoPQ-activated pathogenicity-related protein
MKHFLLFLWLGAGLARGGDYTALDRYVAAPDRSYRIASSRTIEGPGYTAYQLDLVSQSYLTSAEINTVEWHHWLTIFKPAKVTTSTAILFIDGGSNSNTPDTPNTLMAGAAIALNAVVLQLGEIPNEPVKFFDEGRARSEDAFIAYTWDKFLRTGDERWPLRLPMTKAAVRAMDAATSYLAALPGGGVALKNFIVTGGSKRGWTTWTTAAVDARVIAIAPMVIDVLNMQASFAHHWRAYGFWSPAVKDYVDAGIMDWFNTAQMGALMQIEDPFEYRDRFMLPKYLINSSGDQFFLPDSAQFYFDDLPGEKYLRYVPNTDHGLSTLEAPSNLIAWMQAILGNTPRPRFYSRADRQRQTMTLRVVDAPTKVLLWQATNPKARDFRLQTIGPAWTSTPVTGANGIYTVTMPAPGSGYTAFFLELTYPGAAELPLVFTTEVMVSPDTYPFADPWNTKPEHRLRPR